MTSEVYGARQGCGNQMSWVRKHPLEMNISEKTGKEGTGEVEASRVVRGPC